MRGLQVWPLYIPINGLIANIPPHLVDQQSLIAGQNMWLDLDGYYKPRFGYKPYLPMGPGGVILGLEWWTDVDGTSRYIAVNETQIWAIVGGVWTNVTGTTPLAGDASDLVTIVPYFQGTDISVLITNNADPIRIWNENNPGGNALFLTPTYALTGTNNYVGTTSPTFATYPLNTQFFFTFQNNNTGSVQINLNGVGLQPAKKVSGGSIVNFTSGDLVAGTTYNFTWDGTEFLLGTNLLAPAARDIAVVAQRVVAVNVLQGATRYPQMVTWTAAFDATVWPALAFQQLLDTGDPLIAVASLGETAAVVFGEESQWLMSAVQGAQDQNAFTFTPVRSVTIGPVSPKAVVSAEGLIYYFARDTRIWATDGNSTTPISTAIDGVLASDFNAAQQTQVHGVYYAQYRQIWWFYSSKGSSAAGPTHAVVFSLVRQVFETIQVFSEPITASARVVESVGTYWNTIGGTWDQHPVDWSSYPSVEAQDTWLGTAVGQVHRFNASQPNDNGIGVSYSFTPGLMKVDDQTDLLVDSFELFFNPTGVFELATAQFVGMQYPNGAQTIISDVAINDADPFTYKLDKMLPTITQYQRYLEFSFFGVSYNRVYAFGGGNVFGNQQARAGAPSGSF